ncbi:extracellular solute-binding protein [Paenibacillus contaminans]|nr:extracellular solute-binding protein [Paenibacillus contaminans]
MAIKRPRWKASKTFSICLLTALAVTACSSSGNGGSGSSPSSSPAAVKESGSAASEKPNDAVYAENGLPKDQKVTLKVGFFEGGMGREWFDYAMDSFKKKFPNVSFEVVYSPEIAGITSTKISANNKDDMFDMFSGGLPGGNDAINALVTSGKLESQEDLWDRKAYDNGGKTLKELAYPGYFEGAPRIMGKTYALPNAGYGTGLFYNKKLFAQNGWNENPNTWDEFVKLGEDIKAKNIIPISYPGVYPEYLHNAFGAWKYFEMAEINGNLKSFDDAFRNYKLPYYSSPEAKAVWERIYELGKKGFFPKGVAGLNHTQSQMQVLQGKAAMVATGVWVGNEMKDSTPDGFEWGFMVVPMGNKPDSTKWLRFFAANGFYIWSEKPDLNKKWAKEFNVWMWSMDVQQLISEKGGAMPVRNDFLTDPKRADKLQDAVKNMLAYMDKNKVQGETEAHNFVLTDPAAAQAGKVIQEMITEVTEGKLDPVPLLDKADGFMKKAIEAQKK